MKRILWIIFSCFFLSLAVPMDMEFILAAEEDGLDPTKLYAKSAVLMDADSGRVLYEKNGSEIRAMASTTKILTCILALEQGNLEDEVIISKNAASKPKVHLGMREGETFYLKDLLYSLMLESHNDSAAAIAEHIGGSEEGFAKKMNDKAKELGLSQSHFITPNGLDASDEGGKHSTTAKELALIMRYCIMISPQKELFLEITRTPAHSFTDISGKRSFSCNNHNAFLTMMEGALSGKTGFTGDAGYCYVGALKRDNRTFIVALLACGWPNNKGYKWSDTKLLMNYGVEQYAYRSIWEERKLDKAIVTNGVNKENPFEKTVSLPVAVRNPEPNWQMLLREDEQVETSIEMKSTLRAPVEKGEKIGVITYRLGKEALKTFDIITNASVEERTPKWYIQTILKTYCLSGTLN